MKTLDLKNQPNQAKHQGSTQLFEHPLLEKLTRSHFSIPLTLLSLIAASLLFWGIVKIQLNGSIIAISFFSGLFFWTLGEYLLHRFFFHMENDHPVKGRIAYTLHGVHHEYPKDKERIVMPPAGAILIGSVIFGLFYLIMRHYAFAFAPGFLTGYVLYATLHYVVHAYPPPKNIFRWWWLNHSIHHYKHPDKAYGVSSPLWDWVFGTYVKVKM